MVTGWLKIKSWLIENDKERLLLFDHHRHHQHKYLIIRFWSFLFSLLIKIKQPLINSTEYYITFKRPLSIINTFATPYFIFVLVIISYNLFDYWLFKLNKLINVRQVKSIEIDLLVSDISSLLTSPSWPSWPTYHESRADNQTLFIHLMSFLISFYKQTAIYKTNKPTNSSFFNSVQFISIRILNKCDYYKIAKMKERHDKETKSRLSQVSKTSTKTSKE